MAEKRKHAGHGYKHTHITHHDDGSHTIHHDHEDGEGHHKDYAVASLDHAHDGLQDHLGTPNPGEVAADAGDHGIAAPAAQAAGIPAGAGLPGAGA